MRGMEQIGRAQCSTAKLDAGIKLTTFIPVRFVRHKARKVVVEPTTPGRMASPLNPGRPTSVDENLMAALAKAFFWQEMLDTGRVKNMTELAKAEKVGLARMQKMLKLARLAPEIVEDIARGRQPVGLTVADEVLQELATSHDKEVSIHLFGHPGGVSGVCRGTTG